MPFENIPEDATKVRFIFLTCAHQAKFVHKDGTPQRVDGRNATSHIAQVQTWTDKQFENDDYHTILINLGDMTTKGSPDAWEALQSLTTRCLIGNHDQYNFSRGDLSKVMPTPVYSHTERFGLVGGVFFQPFFNQEVTLKTGKNLTPDGRDWADTFPDPAKIIRNYIPTEHAEQLYSYFEKEKKSLRAWFVAAHNPPETKGKFETPDTKREKIQTEEKIKLPSTMLMVAPPELEGFKRSKKGKFKASHINTVIANIETIMGPEKPCLAEIYGDKHPDRYKHYARKTILPSLSTAIKHDGEESSIPEGKILEVVCDTDQLGDILDFNAIRHCHSVPYQEQEAHSILDAIVQTENVPHEMHA